MLLLIRRLRFSSWLFILLIGYASQPAAAQPARLEKLRREVAQPQRADTNQVRRLSELSWALLEQDLTTAQRYGQQALALAQRLHYRRGQLKCLANLAALACRADNLVLATRYYQRVVSLIDPRSRGESRDLTMAILGLADVANTQNEYAQAEHYYLWALGRLRVGGPGAEPDDLAMVHLNLAGLYNEWSETGHGPAYVLPRQEYYARLALATYRRLGSPNDIAMSLGTLGNLYLSRQQYDSAAVCLTQAATLFRQANGLYGRALTAYSLGRVRVRQQRWAEAAAQARESIGLARQVALPDIEARSYHVLGQALLQLGNAAGAYRAAQAELTIRDTLQSSAKRQALARLQVSFDTERKESRIRALTQAQRGQQAEAARQRQRFWLLGAVLLAVAAGLATTAVLALRLRRAGTLVAAQRDELVAARAAQDQLYAVVAHDLRSPVVAFGGLASLLSRYVQRQDTARLAGLGERMQQAAQRLNDLLDNLLNWALSQRGELTAAPQALPAAELLADAVALYQNAALAANVTLAYAAAPGLCLWADPNMTRAILRNLLGNSLRATPAGGTVQLTALAAGPASATIRLHDTGPGYPAPAAPGGGLRAAQPGGGAGLGLALSQHFATVQCGSLRLANLAGGGAEAVLTLPQPVPAAVGAAASPTLPAS